MSLTIPTGEAMNGAIRALTVLSLLVWLLALFGCASTVEIDSEPQGASVEIDGEHVGETPVEYTDTATVLANQRMVLELDGYETVRTTLERDGDINTEALVVGIIGIAFWPLLPAWLWVFDYPDYVDHELTPQEQAALSMMHHSAEPPFEIQHHDDGVTFILEPTDE